MLGAGGELLSGPVPANGAAEPPPASSSAALRAYERRVEAATTDRAAFRESTDNGDAERYAAAGAIVTYAKGFERSPNGRVDREAYSSYARAIARRDATFLDPTVQGINRALLEYALGDECVIAGCDPRGIALTPAPRIASSEQAREAVELAWLALVRDVPFVAYDTDRLVSAAARDLGYAPQTLLRPRNREMTGPIISQLALRDIPMGPFEGVSQRLPCYTTGIDFLVKRDEWLLVQSGNRTEKQNTHDARPRYLSNARDLAGWVSENEPFANAAAIIDDLPDEAHARSWLPQSQSGLLGIGSICAGVGTMYQKLVVQRRLRPEELFGFVDDPDPAVRLDAALTASPVLDRLESKFGSRLLPQAYAGGAPSWAAYPAGHAVGAGIAATMLKANVRGEYVLADPVVPNSDGSALRPYVGTPLTLEDEIDKLAYNYAYGRHAAGVHYRSDSDSGLRFGEAIALGEGSPLKATYPVRQSVASAYRSSGDVYYRTGDHDRLAALGVDQRTAAVEGRFQKAVDQRVVRDSGGGADLGKEARWGETREGVDL